MRMVRTLLTVVSVACAWAQVPNLRPETTLLAEVREKMIELLANQPNYTCLETVERTRQATGGRWQVDDTLRLEVAVVDSKEMFAWPGAKQFEDKSIRELVSTGMFGNGNYAIYARMLFSAAGPEFEYRGEAQAGGTRTLRYDFRVPVSRSGYHLAVGDNEAVAGFHGSIYLDPEKAQLRRLEVVAEDIPPALGLISATDRVDYAQVFISDEEYLLPVESELHMIAKDSDSRNLVRFSGCRKFAGESSLIFDDPEFKDAAVQAPAVVEVDLPADLRMTLEITSDLRLDTGAVGDAVNAVLRNDLKLGKDVLVKKGAVVKGRIVLLERSSGAYAFGLRFNEMEWKGGHAVVRALFDGMAAMMFVGRPKMILMDDGSLLIPSSTRNMRGETMFYRTVR